MTSYKEHVIPRMARLYSTNMRFAENVTDRIDIGTLCAALARA
jgi:hypothetical protein